MLLRQAFEEWLAYQKEIRKYAYGTLKDIKSSFSGLFSYLEKEKRGAIEAQELSPQDVIGWIEHIKKKGVAHTTALKNLSHLTSFLEYLCYVGIISTNPAKTVELKRISSIRTEDFLSQEEIGALFKVARRFKTRAGFRDYCILALLYGTGLRAGELCNLRLEDVNLESETLFVYHGKKGRQRYIPIPKELIPILKDYKLTRGNKGKAFFQMKGERKVSLNYLRELFKGFAKEAGLQKKVTPKTIRHSFATHLLEEGVKLPVVAKLMGHKTLKETNPYIHVSANRLKEAIQEHPAQEILLGHAEKVD